MEWAVAATMTGREGAAIADLAGAGFDVVDDIYVPTVEAPVKAVHGRLTAPWEIAFPGYVFTRTDRYPIPCDGHVIGAVTQNVIDDLRRREGPGGIIRRGLSKCQRRRLRAGQKVRVNAGSLLSGLVGTVRGVDGQDRIVALFELLGRQTPATINATMLTAV
jgi:hypothetical protein